MEETIKKKRVRWTLDLAKNVFEEGGCILLATEYKSSLTRMKYVCECDEEKEITLSMFINGQRCKDCGYKKRKNKSGKSIEEIKIIFEDAGCTLLSTVYSKSDVPLSYVCECDRVSAITLYNFMSGVRCMECGREKTSTYHRTPHEKVIEEFISKKLIPMFKEGDYINKSIPLPYTCPKHEEIGIQYRSRTNLLSSEDGCFHCSRETATDKQRLSFEDVAQEFLEKNVILSLNQTYKNKNQKLLYHCTEHPEIAQYITLRGLRQATFPCIQCRELNKVSSIGKQFRGFLSTWRRDSENSCNRECVITGSQTYDVHHLISYQSILEETLIELKLDIKEDYTPEESLSIKSLLVEKHDLLLGVCVHPYIHMHFHSLYGKVNNTQSQFEEYQERLRLREFDINEILRDREKGD